MIGDLRASLDAGRELSAAMRSHPRVFSPFYISVIRIGETTGELDQSFNRMFEYMEFDKDIRDRIKAAVRYPIIVLVVIAAAVVIVNFAVIPAFAKIFEAQKVPLPLLTRLLIGMSNFFLAYWPLMLAALAVVGLRARRCTWPPSRDATGGTASSCACRSPARSSCARRWRASRAAWRSPCAPACRSCRRCRWWPRSCRTPTWRCASAACATASSAARRVLRTATASGIFTPVVLEMVSVGEETGELDDLMTEVADMYEREVDYDIKNLAANIEPILTVALGVMVLILALGVFLPIWGLGNVMLKK